MKARIIWKLFGAFVLLTFLTLFAFGFFIGVNLRDSIGQKISERLQSDGILVGEILRRQFIEGDQKGIQERARRLAKELNLRITVIDGAGEVLGDSEKEPSLMEDHKDRPEFIQAVKTGFGQSTRFSNTLDYDMKYIAVRVQDNNEVLGVVRIALPVSEVQLQVGVIYRPMLIGAVTVIVVALAAAYFMSRSISSPIMKMKEAAERIAKGDFGSKVKIRGGDELGELAESLNRMADELQLQMDRLRQMDRIRGDFVANVSHELKTPLTSVMGFVETLEDGAINDKENAKKFLAIIKKHTARIRNIIDDLLRLSELESADGSLSLKKARFDLKDLIDEVVTGFGHALGEKRQTLAVESTGRDFSIEGDRDKLEQVFVNLIDNAVKYTKEGGQIKAFLLEQDKAVRVTVEDNGIGIPKEDIERVFERFYRVDKARSRELGGTGLGLAITKHIVLAHNGNIGIESEVGRGTRVIVTLPKK